MQNFPRQLAMQYCVLCSFVRCGTSKTNRKITEKKHNFFDLIFQHDLIPVINKPTRITKRNATAIDHIITNSYLSSHLKTGTRYQPLPTNKFKRYANVKSI